MRRLLLTIAVLLVVAPAAHAYEVYLPITTLVLTYSDADECDFAVVFRFSPDRGSDELTATWTMFKHGAAKFDFPAKLNEFVRSATPPVQFAPHGEARAVGFIEAASKFTSRTEYRIRWDGGYEMRAPSS